MDIWASLLVTVLVVGIVTVVSVLAYEKTHWRKIQKTVDAFVEEINAGKKIVYCSDKIGNSLLLDDNGNEIGCLGKMPLKIKSDVYCFPRFIINCYRVVIERWRYTDDAIVLYVKPIDKATDNWCVKTVTTSYIIFSHPVMAEQTIFNIENISAYKVGEVVTLRSKVTTPLHLFADYNLDYEIVR